MRAGVNAISCDGAATIRKSEFSHSNVLARGPLIVDQSSFSDSSISISTVGVAFEICNSLFVAGPNGPGIFIDVTGADNRNGALILNNTIIITPNIDVG